MAHEIGHILGADHDNSTEPPSIMANVESKSNYFSGISEGQIRNFFCTNNRSCLNNNVVNQSFTNRLTLKLNGNDINTTPVLINKNTKVVTIPPDNNPYVQLLPNTTTFSYSNPSVNVFYNTNTSTNFALGAANSFMLAVSARDQCNYYYWGIPFVYSPSGARVGETIYPVPTDQSITVLPDDPEAVAEIDKIRVFDERGNMQLEVVPTPTEGKFELDTSPLKRGIYYMHVFYKSGEVSKKRFAISHE
jgi:hypothetical protein